MSNFRMCSNCGKDNNYTFNFCSNCGMQLSKNNIGNNELYNAVQSIKANDAIFNQNNKYILEGNKLGIISLILYLGGFGISTFVLVFLPNSIKNYLSAIGSLFPLCGIIVMIVGRVKYPENKLLKVTMWIIIVSIILSFIAMGLFMMWCYMTCTGVDTSGCS